MHNYFGLPSLRGLLSFFLLINFSGALLAEDLASTSTLDDTEVVETEKKSWLRMPSMPKLFKERERPNVQVIDPFLEMRTGPGRGYPTFYIIERGELVKILKRKNEWLKVESPDDKLGWVSRESLTRTLTPDGAPVEFRTAGFEDYKKRRWEAGVLGGELEGASLISGYIGRGFTDNFSLELWAQQSFARNSTNLYANMSIVHQFFPQWRFTPYYTVGVGIITTDYRATSISAVDTKDETVHAGLGLRAFVSRQFMFRLEAREYVVFTSTNDNKEVYEWKAGFAAYF